MTLDITSWLGQVETFIRDHPALAAFGALGLLIAKPLIERWLRGLSAWAAIGKEAADIARHLDRNKSRLEEMQTLAANRTEVPVRIHVQKLAIADRSMLFSDKALEDLPARRIAIVHRARVRCRNYNIDVAEALRTLDDNDIGQFLQLLDYLCETNERLRKWSRVMLRAGDIGGAPLAILGRPLAAPRQD